MTDTGQTKRTLASILMDAGIVNAEQVDAAVQRQLTTGRLIGETLVEMGFTSEENIGWALSKQLGIPYVDIQTGAADLELVRNFPSSLLRRVDAAPLFRNQEEIVIAMSDPTDREAVLELSQAAGMKVSLVIGCPSSIRRTLDSVYGPEREESVPSAPEVDRRTDSGGQAPGETRHRVVWDRSGSTFLLYQVHAARGARASEIHFLPSPDGISVAYRTDQGIEHRGDEQHETALYLRTRLAHLGAPDLEPGAVVTYGSVTVELSGDRIHVGVCHCRCRNGVTTVLRLLPEAQDAPELSTLGLSPIGEAEIRDFVDGPEGLVIVYGPPRSGGSTVLASLAALASRPDRRTIVLEPWRGAPYKADVTRVLTSGAAELSWEQLAVGLGADIVVLDGLLQGDAIAGVLAGASVGRLLFVRTDWLDGQRLLAHLVKSPNGRVVLRDRPFALVKLPNARREGSAVWTTPETSDAQAGLLEVRVLTDEERDALLHAKGTA